MPTEFILYGPVKGPSKYKIPGSGETPECLGTGEGGSPNLSPCRHSPRGANTVATSPQDTCILESPVLGQGVPGSVPSRTQRIGEEEAQPPSSSSSSSLPSSPLGWAPKPPGTVKCHQGCVSDVLCMGCVVSPLFCVSLFRPPSGVGQRDGEDGGDGFGTYFSFSLTTGRG